MSSAASDLILKIVTECLVRVVQNSDGLYKLSYCQNADWLVSGADREHKHPIVEARASLYHVAPHFIASSHETLPPLLPLLPRRYPILPQMAQQPVPTQPQDQTLWSTTKSTTPYVLLLFENNLALSIAAWDSFTSRCL